MEAVRSSEDVVNVYRSTRRHTSEDSNLHSHYCENTKFNRINELANEFISWELYATEHFFPLQELTKKVIYHVINYDVQCL
jgi:hypothetical protein